MARQIESGTASIVGLSSMEEIVEGRAEVGQALASGRLG